MVVVVFVVVVVAVVLFLVSLRLGLLRLGILTTGLVDFVPLNIDVNRSRHRTWLLFPGKVRKVSSLSRAPRLSLVHASVQCTVLDHNLDLAFGQRLDIVARKVIVQEKRQNDAFKNTQPGLAPHPHDHSPVQDTRKMHERDPTDGDRHERDRVWWV